MQDHVEVADKLNISYLIQEVHPCWNEVYILSHYGRGWKGNHLTVFSEDDIMDTSESIVLKVMDWGCPHHYSADIPFARSSYCSQDLIVVVHSLCHFFRKMILQRYIFPSGILLWGFFSRSWRVPVKISCSGKKKNLKHYYYFFLILG